MTRKTIRAGAEGLPEMTRRQALTTALTVAFTAHAGVASAASRIESASSIILSAMAEIHGGEFRAEVDHEIGYVLFRRHSADVPGPRPSPVSFESIEPAPPADRVNWVQVNPYAMQNAINICSRAIDDHVEALDAHPVDDELVSTTSTVAYWAFQYLLELPCRSHADITAKARAILNLAPRGGYYPLEASDTATLLRSIAGEA